jgi:predicted DNA-binding protein (UPF0251 family)
MTKQGSKMTGKPVSQSPARKAPAKRQNPSKARSEADEGEALPLGSLMLPEAKPQRTKGVVRARLSAQTKAAIELMAYEGLELPEAAEKAGMQVNSLKDAMRKNHVKQAYNQLVTEIRSGSAIRAFLRVNRLSAVAKSEDVRLRAGQWVAGVGDIAPIRRVEGRHSHHVSFAGFDMDLNPLDITPDDDA